MPIWGYEGIVIAVLGLVIFGLWEEHKADKLLHANDQATIQQNLRDRAESAKQIGILETKLGALDVKVQPIIQRIVSAPSTTGCGPSVGFAVDGVRDLYSADQKPAGPQPVKPTGVPTPLHTAGKSQR